MLVTLAEALEGLMTDLEDRCTQNERGKHDRQEMDADAAA